MQVTKNITLDLLETGSPVIIKAKQNDRNTRYIAAHLYVDGLAYPVPSGTEIAFRYKKPDGTAGFYDTLPDNSPAITVSGNTVTVELVEQVLTEAGCVHCEINMYNAASEKLTTFTFEISVEESVLTDAEITSSDYYNVLTAEIAKALQAVTDATEQAENAAQSAQDAADSAAMSKDWAAGQPVTYSGTPVSIAYAGENRIASITAYGENAQGGTTEAPVALTGVDSVFVGGRNLLPKATKTQTIYGVTFTPNPDGSVSVSGTCAGGIATYNYADNLVPISPNQVVYLSGASQLVKVVINEKTPSGAFVRNVLVDRGQGISGTLTKQKEENILYATLQVQIGDTPNLTIYPMLNLGNTAMPYEPYQGSVTPLPIPRPLRRVGDVKDKCVTRQDYESAEKLVVTYNVGFVELDGTEAWQASSQTSGMFFITRDNISAAAAICSNFNFSKSATTEQGKFYIVSNQIRFLTSYETLESWKNYLAAQKAEGTPVQIAYQLATPEVYATDPIDFDNAAGPLTVMTGGEVGVRMTELIGSRSPELTAKMDRGIYFQVGNLNLGDNTNFLNPVNQQGQASYSAKNGSTLCIDRWILGSGGAYDVAARTLSAASYANRACGLWQANHLGEHWLEIGSTITFSAYINGKYHSGTMAVLNRDSYSSFSAVPAGYTCDDFEVVCCTYAGNPLLYNLGIYAKKQLVINWVKWERGSAATPYALKPFPDELAICQRYFNAIAIEVAPAYFLNGSIHYFPASLFPARMRVVPTIEIISAGVGNVGTVAASAVTVAMDVNGIREIIVNAGTSAYDIYNKLTLDMRISANY